MFPRGVLRLRAIAADRNPRQRRYHDEWAGATLRQERELAYDDLRDWIKKLDKAGELKRIKAEVDPILEMAEIADRAAKLGKGTAAAGGPALLFENVTGYPGAKVLMNQFGSERRMKLALETDSLDAIAERIRVLIHPESPTSFLDKIKLLPKLAEVGSFFPKVVSAKDAACKE